jgi:hypothetical protein
MILFRKVKNRHLKFNNLKRDFTNKLIKIKTTKFLLKNLNNLSEKYSIKKILINDE